ncbi:MAG: hypothetical protein WC410_00455 [Candidatus Paceibacterota bacterium]|jgi:hypothetical protein
MDVFREKLARYLVFVSIFLVFFSIPLIIFKNLQKTLVNLEIREDLEQLAMWAEFYKDQYGTYKGMEKELEIDKLVKTLNYLDAECLLIIGSKGNKFCARARVFDKEIKNWCVDSAKYSGSIINNCDYGKEIKCQ